MKKLLVSACLLLSVSMALGLDKMTPEFLWKLGRVSDPQLSHDGRECLYNIREQRKFRYLESKPANRCCHPAHKRFVKRNFREMEQ